MRKLFKRVMDFLKWKQKPMMTQPDNDSPCRREPLKMSKEDLLDVRRRIAELGEELTPDQILETLNEVRDIEIVDEPGLVSYLRKLRRD